MTIISDLEHRDDLFLLTLSQDTEELRKRFPGYDGFLVDGEELEVWGFERIIPYDGEEVDLLVQNGRETMTEMEKRWTEREMSQWRQKSVWTEEVAALLTERYEFKMQHFSMRDLWLQNLTPTEAANIIREA